LLQDFVDMVRGKTNSQKLFMKGKLKVCESHTIVFLPFLLFDSIHSSFTHFAWCIPACAIVQWPLMLAVLCRSRAG
jgi:hypothetical protein